MPEDSAQHRPWRSRSNQSLTRRSKNWRGDMYAHLLASVPYLLGSSPREAAIELVVQGLDLVDGDSWADVLIAAQDELMNDGH